MRKLLLNISFVILFFSNLSFGQENDTLVDLPNNYWNYKIAPDDIFVYSFDNKNGLIRFDGKVITGAIYDTIYTNLAYRNYWVYKNNRKYGILNSTGDIVINNMTSRFGVQSTNFITIEINKKWHIMKNNGVIINRQGYDNSDLWFDKFGFMYFSLNNRWGVMNKNFDVIIPPEYKEPVYFGEYGIGKIKIKNRYGFIDTNNVIVILPTYKKAKCFSDSLAPVKNRKWGYIDLSNKTIIPFVYGQAGEFFDNFAPVKKNGKYGYINKSNETMISFTLNWAGRFYEDEKKALIKKSIFKWKEIDREGNIYNYEK